MRRLRISIFLFTFAFVSSLIPGVASAQSLETQINCENGRTRVTFFLYQWLPHEAFQEYNWGSVKYSIDTLCGSKTRTANFETIFYSGGFGGFVVYADYIDCCKNGLLFIKNAEGKVTLKETGWSTPYTLSPWTATEYYIYCCCQTLDVVATCDGGVQLKTTAKDPIGIGAGGFPPASDPGSWIVQILDQDDKILFEKIVTPHTDIGYGACEEWSWQENLSFPAIPDAVYLRVWFVRPGHDYRYYLKKPLAELPWCENLPPSPCPPGQSASHFTLQKSGWVGIWIDGAWKTLIGQSAKGQELCIPDTASKVTLDVYNLAIKKRGAVVSMPRSNVSCPGRCDLPVKDWYVIK